MLGVSSAQPHGHLPLPLDVALPIVGFAIIVFVIVTYDLYRYANRNDN